MSTEEEGAKSDRNHAVLAKMMRALKSQKCSSSRSNNKGSSLFITKKSFAASNNNLFGRQTLLQKLQQLFKDSCSSNQNASYLALVHGRSGSGKSSLIDAFFKTLHHQHNGIQVLSTAGKFDLLQTHLPYAALIKAANDLARKALKSPNADIIKKRLLDELGPDIDLLATIVKEVSLFLSHQRKPSSSNVGKAFSRFKLLLRSFMRSIATRETPVILFFDDLQWADEETMEMLKALLADKLSNHVMIILSYRDDEMDTKTLQKHFSISAFDDESASSQLSSYLTNVIHKTEIGVPNLDAHALNQMVSAVLNEPEDSTISLSNIILNKTQGNPFYALNFMDMLHTNDMLQQLEDGKWEWNESIILQQTDVSDNLAKILESKILRLPEKVRSILQLAAFIGHDFASSVLVTIVYEEQDMIEDDYSFELYDREVIQLWIVDALNLALEEGLVELSATDEFGGTYKFSHDRIQHCLYKDLMPDDVERRLLHQRIGKLIWKTISSQEHDKVDDWILFLAVDNLNRGPKFVDNDDDRVELIELNIRAGKLASSKAAFLVGVEYLRSGRKLITDDSFVESNYELCMDLYCAAANMERIVGNFDRSNELTKKIHKYARKTEDEFPAFLTEIKSMATQNDLKNAMAMAFKVLKQMGVKFPKKITVVTMIREFIRTKAIIGKRTPEELMDLPMLTDRKKLFALELLSAINLYAFFAGESAKFTFVAMFLRMMTLTLRHGLSDLYAPQAFVGYGVVCCFFGKLSLGLSFGDVAGRLSERNDAQGTEARTQVPYLTFVRPWTHGLDEVTCESFLQVYHKGMLVGDIDFACAAAIGWLLCGYNGLAPLDKVAAKGKRFRLEFEEHGEKSILLLGTPVLQAINNIHGDELNKDPAILDGENMNLEEFTATVKAKMELCVLKYCELDVALFFGDWGRLRIHIIPTLEPIAATLEGHFTFPSSLASFVWCSYKLYNLTGKNRHVRIGRRRDRQLREIVKRNTPLATSVCGITAAAKAAFVKKRPVEECEELFVSAMRDLEETRYCRLQSCVADELADLFFQANNYEKGVKYLQESLNCCTRWGAKEKTKRLEMKLSAVERKRREEAKIQH